MATQDDPPAKFAKLPLAAFELPKCLVEPAVRSCRLFNTALDFIFNDVPTLRAGLAEKDAPMQAQGEKKLRRCAVPAPGPPASRPSDDKETFELGAFELRTKAKRSSISCLAAAVFWSGGDANKGRTPRASSTRIGIIHLTHAVDGLSTGCKL